MQGVLIFRTSNPLPMSRKKNRTVKILLFGMCIDQTVKQQKEKFGISDSVEYHSHLNV